MSSLEEQLQDLIHTNLCLLRDNGHKIYFQEGMFRERNLPGFEAVGHALLMIIDKTECTRNITWPLLDDKSLRVEFRKNFSKFIKTVNSKYPEACIPEIAPSTLQSPGGLKFLRFMYRLSTFVLELELKRIMSPDEANELLPRFVPSKQAKDNVVKLNIVRGACIEQQQNLQEVEEYLTSAMPVLEKLNNIDSKVQDELHNVQTELEAKVSSLDFDDATKNRLRDIEDTVVIQDWDGVTDGKRKELEEKVKRVLVIRDSSAAATTQLRAAQTASVGAVSDADRVSMDGKLLGDLNPLAKLAGRAVLNDRGQVRLETVYRAGTEAARRLAARRPPTDLSQQSPVLPTAQTLLADTRAVHVAASKALADMHKMKQDNKKVVAKLRPIMYTKVRGSVMPDHFKYLKPRKVLKFTKPSLSTKKKSRRQKSGNWLTLFDILKKGHIRKNYNCSYKLRYKPHSSRLTYTVQKPSSATTRLPTTSRASLGTSQKPFSTPKLPCATTATKRTKRLQETLASHATGVDVLCRRSLYRNLPTGPKPKPNQVLSEMQENLSDLSFSSSEEFPLAPIEEHNSATFSPLQLNSATSSLEPSVPENVPPQRDGNSVATASTHRPKAGRKSIDVLVERYRKLKESMATNAEKL